LSFKRHRFPPDAIRHPIWLYFRFTLSLGDVEDLMAQRGIIVSPEAIRCWVNTFGPLIVANLRRLGVSPLTSLSCNQLQLTNTGVPPHWPRKPSGFSRSDREDPMTYPLMSGFSAATLIPALASALKQSQREAAGSLHILAEYHQRQRPYSRRPSWLTKAERQAACEVGTVLVEQGFNCAVLFLAVNGAALLAGPVGGMLVQVAITWNTIVTPEQVQKVNPARVIADQFDWRPDWVAGLPEDRIETFALMCGQWASRCGYGAREPDLGAPASASGALC
jgi:hypothetical protein